MFARHRLAALALATTLLAPVAALATDDNYTAPYSSASTLINLCGTNNPVAADACKEAGYDKLATQLDRAVQAVLAKAPATVKPLLRRDQGFFYEMIISAAEEMPGSGNDDTKNEFTDLLRQRVAALEKIGFGRSGISGKWQDAFGTVTVLPADENAYRIAIDTSAVYGGDDERRAQCRAIAIVKPSAGGWLTGTMQGALPAPVGDKPAQPTLISIRRQGETLRVVAEETGWENERRPDCKTIRTVTANYFASGKDEAATDKADTAFVTPSFDCTKPATASEEEICGDPDLADNDQRLNRAWRALLPRLDEATRRALAGDQRGWVHAQGEQYPEWLHPAWNKTTYFMHFTSDGRDRMNKMQRERIALLEGFDETRNCLAGAWLSSTAILNVTRTDDGGLKAVGWKREQGDWKAGCDYDMSGKLVKGVFRSGEERKNPDTLERDHAMLIVNRMDDAFAKKRHGADGEDEPKCKRGFDRSSTTRLFPAKPSADINDFGGSIR
jgi:uncharacterized protein YecT (DUF1311 family)